MDEKATDVQEMKHYTILLPGTKSVTALLCSTTAPGEQRRSLSRHSHCSAACWSTQGLRMDRAPSSWPPPNLAVSFVFVGTVTTAHIFGFNESFPSARRPAGRCWLSTFTNHRNRVLYPHTHPEKETLNSYWHHCHSTTLQGQLNFPPPQPGILDWSWKAVDVDTLPCWKSICVTVWPIRFLARWQQNNQIIGVRALNAAPRSCVTLGKLAHCGVTPFCTTGSRWLVSQFWGNITNKVHFKASSWHKSDIGSCLGRHLLEGWHSPV